MQRTRWAVLGPGQIAGDFVAALPRSRGGVLQAVGSTDPGRAERFARAHGAPVWGRYDDILGRDDIDAVYVATVHPAHADLAIAALRAGHGVLCEKPLTPTLADTERVLAVAAETGRPLIEAFKNRFSPFTAALHDLIAGGGIGQPVRFEAAFGFRAMTRSGRLFDPALAGGALLDVGCYPVSAAVGVAAAAGIDPAALRIVEATGTIGPTGVDERARAVIGAGDFTARIETSIRANLTRAGRLVGTAGEVELPDAWGSRTASPTRLQVSGAAGAHRIETTAVDPFAAEADALALALADGRAEAPEMPWQHTRAVARLLEDWAVALRA